jgi:hypothetical protein
MGDRRSSGPAIAALRKTDVERMLRRYDDDPIGSLTAALRIVADLPDASWPELIGALDVTDSRRAALLIGEERTLDALVAELNERRDVG